MLLIPSVNEKKLDKAYQQLVAIRDIFKKYTAMLALQIEPEVLSTERDLGVFSELEMYFQGEEIPKQALASHLRGEVQYLKDSLAAITRQVRRLLDINKINRFLTQGVPDQGSHYSSFDKDLAKVLSNKGVLNVAKSRIGQLFRSALYQAYGIAMCSLRRDGHDQRLVDFTKQCMPVLYNRLLMLRYCWWVWLLGYGEVISKWLQCLQEDYKFVSNLRACDETQVFPWVGWEAGAQVMSSNEFECYLMRDALPSSHTSSPWCSRPVGEMKAHNYRYWVRALATQLRHEAPEALQKHVKGALEQVPRLYIHELANEKKQGWVKLIRLHGVEQFYSSNWCGWIASLYHQSAMFTCLEDQDLQGFINDLQILNQYSHKAYLWSSHKVAYGAAKEYRDAMERVGFEFNKGGSRCE